MNSIVTFGTGILFFLWAVMANNAGTHALLTLVLLFVGIVLCIPATFLAVMDDVDLVRRGMGRKRNQ